MNSDFVDTVDLDRRFLEWEKDSESDPEVWARFRISDGTFEWADLLKWRRVVVLAEGGSGKSTEFQQQARAHANRATDAWYLTVQRVAEDGIEGSLPPSERARFRDWHASNRPGWFFVDSVDEARLNRVRFEKALDRIAEGIAGAEGRAHVIISSRHTDWESQRDLARLNEALPIPTERETPSEPSPDELLKRILHNERREEGDSKNKETARVVIMMPLDKERVRKFAEQRAIPEVDEFISQVEEEDLWQFVRRPADLDWLVAYWRENRRLGSLAEMLHTSLRERLREVDPQRDRLGALDATRAMAALERIGAALVFARAATIAIPDGQMDLDRGEALKIQDILPDLSGPERADLIMRPVFDPGTFGRARLHNDNLGVVRAYLAAQWLLRLRRGNLSNRELFSLLFGDPYGEKVIIPSVRETAAWLSLWDRDVGREVAQREPWVLLTGGDPGSLPRETRRAVLVELARRMVHEGFLVPVLDADSLKRYASPDLADTVRSLWVAHPDHRELRSLLLRLILLGRVKACEDLVAELAFGGATEGRFQMLAGKALLAIADEPTKRRYAEYVLAHLSELPNVVIWDAVEGLFPTLLTPDELLAITNGTDVTDSDGGLGFEWQGPDLVNRLTSRPETEGLLRGLLAQLGGRPGGIGKLPEKREEAFGPAIGTVACNLLRLSGPDEAPPLAIEAALRLAGVQRSTITPWKAVRELPGLLLKTSSRRRLAFWEAARRLSDHPALHRPLDEPYQMQVLGWSPGLKLEDLDWLLIDGPQRTAANERRLAVNAALEIAHRAGSEPIVSRIREIAMTDPEMQAGFEAATTPRTPSPEHLASEAELNEAIRRNEAAQAERDQSWIELLADLRADPAQLRRLLTPSEKGVDPRLHGLWQLLSHADRGNRYAIDNLASIEPILGAELAEELRRALIGFWRQWTPRLASTRAPSERNQVSTLDCMGITGITLEAQADAAWASRLDSAEASKAASFATIELAGFPVWLLALARAHPWEVEAVLGEEVRAEISDDSSVSHYKVLQAIAYADAEIKRRMAPVLLQELKARSELPYLALEFLLDVVGQNLPTGQHSEILSIALERFDASDSLATAALYIGAAFSIDPGRSTRALDARLDRLSPEEQKELVERLLPLLFGDRASSEAQNPKELTFPCLVRLVKSAYATVKVSEDRQHGSGAAYSPDQRDRAEWARNAAFKTLVETPGWATYETLHKLEEVPGFPIPPERLASIALDRAAADAEHAPWRPGDAKAFEETREPAPRTTLDLQRLALSRFADFQDDLLTSDFAQGRTVKGLTDENAVQGWAADRLDLNRRSSYSVERESRVVEEKEPDIRLRAKASAATLPIEVKLTDRWTLEELEDALLTQLCGKYLRAKDARHGILLIVHREARDKGWELKGTRTYLTFEQVVAHLKSIAREISAADPTGPQPDIAVLDVSSMAAE